MTTIGKQFAEVLDLALLGLSSVRVVLERRWTLEIINSFKIKKRYPNDHYFLLLYGYEGEKKVIGCVWLL